MLRAIVAAGRVLQLDPGNQEARSFLEGVQRYGLGNYVDPQIDAMVRSGASLALAGAGPSVPTTTGSGTAADHETDGPPLELMAGMGIGLAGAVALAGVLIGASAVVRRARKGRR